MKRYVIEREISGVGGLTGAELKGAAQQSNAALAKLAGKTQWIQSYVADNKTLLRLPGRERGRRARARQAQRLPRQQGNGNLGHH